MLALTRWSTMSASEKLADCANLTTVVPPPNSAAPALVAVTFLIRCGLFEKGESAALPTEEAAAVVAPGFAEYA